MTFILGLTGGIATGKSTVSEYFIKKGIPVVDADVGARKVVEPQTEGLQRITTVFGKEVLHSDGTLNRKYLGEIVFRDKEKLQLLNSLLHDLIRKWIQQETDSLLKETHPLIVWDIPLLYEVHYETDCDAIMVVYVSKEVQLQRLMAREHFDAEQAKNRIKNQMPIEEKRKRADVVIDNNGSVEATYRQVDKWLEENTALFEEPRK